MKKRPRVKREIELQRVRKVGSRQCSRLYCEEIIKEVFMSAVFKNETLNVYRDAGLHLAHGEESLATEKKLLHPPVNVDVNNTTGQDDYASKGHSLPKYTLLDPAKIRVSKMPGRENYTCSGRAFENLCSSMKFSNGNKIPIHVRKLNSDELGDSSGTEYELISGERRLRAAEKNSQSVLSMIFDELQEIDCALLKIIENSNHLKLNVYETSLQIKYLKDEFSHYSQENLGAIFSVDKSTICRALKLASLPLGVIAAFSSVKDLQYRDAEILWDALNLAESNVINEANLIITQRNDDGIKFKREEVVRRLLDAAKNCDTASSDPGCIAIMRDATEIGKIIRKKKGLTINLSSELSDKQFSSFVAKIKKLLA